MKTVGAVIHCTVTQMKNDFTSSALETNPIQTSKIIFEKSPADHTSKMD